MPVLSRSVIVNKQKKRQQMEFVKNIRKTFSSGLAVLSATAMMQTISSSSKVSAEGATISASTRTDFLNSISGRAKTIAAQNDLYASVMIAQAILESGWGTATLSQAPYNNLFGVKARNSDESVVMQTLEDDGTGNYYTANEAFKKYDDLSGSLNDYASLLTGDNDPNSWRYSFYLGARVSQTNSYEDATAHLTGRYATDTHYGTKLNSIIESNQLTAYDTVPERVVKPETDEPSETNIKTSTPVVTSSSYTVELGDSYWALARKFGTDVATLQAMNQATNGNLYVGQTLKVPSTVTETTEKESTESVITTTPLSNQSRSAESQSESTVKETAKTYQVVYGDTYWAIARKFGVSVDALITLNGSMLYAGQTVKLPANSTVPAVETPVAPSNNTTSTSSVVQAESTTVTTPTVQTNAQYVVVANDSLWGIATRHNMSVAQLSSANGLSEQSIIYPGQVLNVSGNVNTPVVPTAVSVDNSVAEEVVETVTNVTLEESAPVVVTPTTTGQYTVVNGDTLYSIARLINVDVQTLIANNGGSTMIRVGQVINY